MYFRYIILESQYWTFPWNKSQNKKLKAKIQVAHTVHSKHPEGI